MRYKNNLFSFARALLCGVLLYYAQEIPWLVIVVPICFAYLCHIQDSYTNFNAFLHILVFIVCYIFLQTSFLWNAGQKNGLEILYGVFPFLIYLTPQLIILYIKKNRAILFICGWLFSELLFTNIELGCPIYQIGNIWAHTPIFIQWYEYTGILGGSIWTLALGYLLMKRQWKYFGFFLIIPILLSISLYNHHGKELKRSDKIEISIVSLNKKYSSSDIDSLLYINRFHHSDLIVFPEAIFMCHENTYNYTPTLTSIKRHLTDSLSSSSVVMGLWLYNNNKELYNVALVYSNTINLLRYKQYRMTFAEFLPNASLLGKIKFIRNMVVYPVDIRENKQNVITIKNITFSPLICYESICPAFICRLVREGSNFFTISASNSSLNSCHIEKTANNILKALAIATRRSIIRAVDNGESCFISSNGTISNIEVNTTCLETQSVVKDQNYSVYVLMERELTCVYFILLFLVVTISGFVRFK